MKKQNWILGAVLAVCGAGALAAETYTSDGFSARITNSGMIENLRYREQLLCKLIQLNGSYRLPPDAQKYDARFFQSWDGSGKAVCKRDGDTMMVTIDSKLGNKVLKDAADYKVEAMLTPNHGPHLRQVERSPADNFQPFPDDHEHASRIFRPRSEVYGRFSSGTV